jgi:hypothetical protein
MDRTGQTRKNSLFPGHCFVSGWKFGGVRQSPKHMRTVPEVIYTAGIVLYGTLQESG